MWLSDKVYKHVMSNTRYCTFIVPSSQVPLWPTPPTQYSSWNKRIPDTWPNLDLMFGSFSWFIIFVLKHGLLVPSSIWDRPWSEYVIFWVSIIHHLFHHHICWYLQNKIQIIKCKQINTYFKHSRYLANRIPIYSWQFNLSYFEEVWYSLIYLFANLLSQKYI